MDIVLGVSMTPTTVRMVLVEGDKADGRTVDHDVFDIAPANDAANSSASDQVISAILGTQQSAAAGGHRLIAIGVTWSDYAEAGVLRDGLAARGIDDVMLVSQLHAAGALAQAAGRAVGYDTTALLFVERDTATLSVVEAEDGSIVKVVSRSLHSADAMSVMAEMVAELEAQDVRPGGCVRRRFGRRRDRGQGAPRASRVAAGQRTRGLSDGAGPRRRARGGMRAAIRGDDHRPRIFAKIPTAPPRPTRRSSPRRCAR